MSDAPEIIGADEVLIVEEIGAGFEHGSIMSEGIAVAATTGAIVARYGEEAGGLLGQIAVPWPDVLKHAPTEAMAQELKRRDTDDDEISVEIENEGHGPYTVVCIVTDDRRWGG
ncbi:MAG TPA: hypothetical protein HA263_08160 [Methanoregulaceae archaeon]|nr:hypothetical protein [Methanoregulaceae archaeon]